MTDTAHLNQLTSGVKGNAFNASPIALWVPSAEILCFTLPPLTAPKKKWDQLIPWQLEDELLQTPDQYHFVWNQPTAEEDIQILAVPKSVIQNWRLLAESSEQTPIQMAPDFLALPEQEDDWTAYIDGNDVTIRTGAASGFACDLPFFWQLLSRELAQKPEFRAWLWSNESLDLPEALAESDRVEVQVRELKWDYLELPHDWNLLSAEHARTKSTPRLPVTALTLALSAAVGVLFFGYLWLAANVYKSNADKLEQAIVAEFAARFEVQVTDAVIARSQAQQILESRKTTDRLIAHSQLATLLDADSALSACSSCELQSAILEDDALILTLADKAGLESELAVLNKDFQMQWGVSNSKGENPVRILSLFARAEGNHQ
ncbi:hypothetical protein HBA55_17580 [Pseudomaricurvus alkylphenolicus]|uniref:type II secretion system protein GspL n=1 Tax=Pseudomaricurvus alkylphenolicus TaxID=1306991 RepID=UPI001420385C|nr:type II secretion system protein GspL [Pseudomaricurvus alkylphenolicus]NIB41419.1 hypothetical protein [Pseudomaricurvus alkylphenolicus]